MNPAGQASARGIDRKTRPASRSELHSGQEVENLADRLGHDPGEVRSDDPSRLPHVEREVEGMRRAHAEAVVLGRIGRAPTPRAAVKHRECVARELVGERRDPLLHQVAAHPGSIDRWGRAVEGDSGNARSATRRGRRTRRRAPRHLRRSRCPDRARRGGRGSPAGARSRRGLSWCADG